MKHMLIGVALAVCCGFIAGTVLADSGGSTGARDCPGANCAGELDTDCTTGPCEGGTYQASSECIYACCYGTGGFSCGATDELQTGPIP